MRIPDTLSAYEDYLVHERRLSHLTCQAYFRDLRALVGFCDKDLAAYTLGDFRAFLRYMGAAGVAVATVQRRFHSYHTYWRWAKLQGLVPDGDLPASVRLPRKKRCPPRALAGSDLSRWLSHPDDDERLALAWQLLGLLGLRRGELLSLLVGDIDLAKQTLMVKGKGGHIRLLPLPDALLHALQALVVGRETSEPLFTLSGGRPVSVTQFNKHFKRRLRACGLAGRGITPHTFRHTVASLLIARGVSVVYVQKLLGHRDLKTTMLYVDVADSILADVVNKFANNHEAPITGAS